MNIKEATRSRQPGLPPFMPALPGLQAETELVDQVVAIVDDDIIMASELRERVDRPHRNHQVTRHGAHRKTR